jgi:O-antigen ligase
MYVVLGVLATAAGLALGLMPMLRILTFASLAGTIAVVRFRTLGLLSVGMLCLLDPLSRSYILYSSRLPWNTISFLLIGLAALYFQRLLHRPGLPTLWLCALLGVLGLGLLWTESADVGKQHVIAATAFFGLLAVFRVAGDEPEIWRWLALVLNAVGAGVGLVYYREPAFVQAIVNVNALAYCWLTAAFTTTLDTAASNGRARGRGVLDALTLVNAGWIFLTGSRGSLLVCSLSLAFCFGLGDGRRRVRLAAAVFAVILAVGLYEARATVAIGRIQHLFDSERSASLRTSGRYDLAVAGWNIFLANPVFGAGTGEFAVRWSRLETLSVISNYGIGHEVQAHSAWISTLAENGIVGAIPLLGFILSFAWLGWKRGGALRWLGFFTSFSLATSFISTEFQAKGLWWLTAGALFLLERPPAKAPRAAVPRAIDPAAARQP